MSIRERIKDILLDYNDGRSWESCADAILAAFLEELPEEKEIRHDEHIAVAAVRDGWNAAIKELKTRLGEKKNGH